MWRQTVRAGSPAVGNSWPNCISKSQFFACSTSEWHRLEDAAEIQWEIKTLAWPWDMWGESGFLDALASTARLLRVFPHRCSSGESRFVQVTIGRTMFRHACAPGGVRAPLFSEFILSCDGVKESEAADGLTTPEKFTCSEQTIIFRGEAWEVRPTSSV